jgi:hypothetical protein
MSHLYLMQNHIGLIKIGKSKQVEARKRQIEKVDLCTLEIVKVLYELGNDEPFYHSVFRKNRAVGEWFYGDKKALKKASSFFLLGRNFVWPYVLAEDKVIDDWLKRVEDCRYIKSAKSLLQRQLLIMQEQENPNNLREDIHRRFNWKIWQLLNRFENYREVYCSNDQNGPHLGFTGEDEIIEIPQYTNNLEAALSLWPYNKEPTNLTGLAWDCCLEGLAERIKWVSETRTNAPLVYNEDLAAKAKWMSITHC